MDRKNLYRSSRTSKALKVDNPCGKMSDVVKGKNTKKLPVNKKGGRIIWTDEMDNALTEAISTALESTARSEVAKSSMKFDKRPVEIPWSAVIELLPFKVEMKKAKERYKGKHGKKGVIAGPWEESEDAILHAKQAELGNKWSKIATFLEVNYTKYLNHANQTYH